MSSGVWLNTSNFNKTGKPTSIHEDSYFFVLGASWGFHPKHPQMFGDPRGHRSSSSFGWELGAGMIYPLASEFQQSHHMTPKPLAKHQVVKLAIQTCKACAMENHNLYNRMKQYETYNTVDGQNPAPPRMMIIPLFIGFENHSRWLFGISSINCMSFTWSLWCLLECRIWTIFEQYTAVVLEIEALLPQRC